MRKNAIFCLAALLISLCLCSVALAAEVNTDFDFVRFAKEMVLKDFHPTVNLEKVTGGLAEPAFEKEPGIIRAKVQLYYTGWIRRHDMLVEIDYRESDKAVKVNVLNDSNNVNLAGAHIFKDSSKWIPLATIEWK